MEYNYKSITNTVWLGEFKDFSSLKLTIYWLSPCILTRHPLSECDVVRYVNSMYMKEPESAQKIVIHGQQLNEHADLLNQLNNLNLTPTEEKQKLCARIHYVFETSDGTSVFRVSMSGLHRFMLVNGKAVKRELLLYEVLIPFAYGESLKQFQRIIGRGLEL